MNIVNTNGYDAMGAVLYGPPSQQLISYIQTNYQKLAETMSGYNDKFLSMVKGVVSDITSDDNINKAKEYLNKVSYSARDDMIYYVDYHNLGSANYMMQQHIMSHPTMQMYHNQGVIDGYSHSLVSDGNEDVYYNNVVSGWETSDDSVKGTCFLFEDSSDLDIDTFDSNSIIRSYRNALIAVRSGIDPSTIEMDEI